jgi:hypothetical protein
MSDIRQTLQAELRALESQLRENSIFQKIEGIRKLLELYDSQTPPRDSSLFAPTKAVALEPSGAGHMRNKSRGSTRRVSPDRERALMAAAEYIKDRVHPTRTSEILDHLRSLEIPVAGNVPLSNLSAMMFHSPIFTSHGRKGWVLTRDDDVLEVVLARHGAAAPSEQADVSDGEVI